MRVVGGMRNPTHLKKSKTRKTISPGQTSHSSRRKSTTKSASDISSVIGRSIRSVDRWKSRWPQFDEDETLRVPRGKMIEVLEELAGRLEDNYPFHHPSYAGQMLKPPHPIASIAYFLTQQINPNNHALDGGPATAKMEMEVIAQLAAMFGFKSHLGHLTSSGTIANLEALWIARSIHPDRAIAFSSEAHYTHRRMCDVIRARGAEIAVDGKGKMDLDDLRSKLKAGNIGTVVMTAGTTGLGSIDPIDEALTLKEEFEFRIHVDAAYGGFFRLLTEVPGALHERATNAFRAIENVESVVVDPHKHGLQPYGCGSVIFRDPAIGSFYKHDSPYTYFSSKDVHLGEISLECSRAGAAAAALWATLKCFPLNSNDGLGRILSKTRKAALVFAQGIARDRTLRLVTEPELDIVSYFAVGKNKRTSVISRNSDLIFAATANERANPVYLAKMTLKRNLLSQFTDIAWDNPTLTVLRSVLMKPEHLRHAPALLKSISDCANRTVSF